MSATDRSADKAKSGRPAARSNRLSPLEKLPSSRRSFRPEPTAAIAARRTFDGLTSELDEELVERGRLALTEAVANCVKHARLSSPQLIDMEVWVLSDLLRIEVTDSGSGFDSVAIEPSPNTGQSGGWGLWLVAQLTDRWGVDVSHSTRIWMEFDRTSQ
jgi:anti-sigma regulatory factor (Ser/Thr protein kinase)